MERIFRGYEIVQRMQVRQVSLCFRNLQFLLEFDHLTSLNLDHNIVDEHTVFPYMPQLELLWLNHNGIDNLYPFIKNLHKSLPNLKYLCLMGNNVTSSYLNDGTSYEHLKYRCDSKINQ